MMKNCVKLLLVCLGVLSFKVVSAEKSDALCVVSAQSEFLPAHAQAIKSFVSQAQQLGFSDQQIVEAFAQAASKLEENNGVLTLSLNYDKKVVYCAIGVLSVAAVAALSYVVYHYVIKGADKPVAATESSSTENAPNNSDAANEEVVREEPGVPTERPVAEEPEVTVVGVRRGRQRSRSADSAEGYRTRFGREVRPVVRFN